MAAQPPPGPYYPPQQQYPYYQPAKPKDDKTFIIIILVIFVTLIVVGGIFVMMMGSLGFGGGVGLEVVGSNPDSSYEQLFITIPAYELDVQVTNHLGRDLTVHFTYFELVTGDGVVNPATYGSYSFVLENGGHGTITLFFLITPYENLAKLRFYDGGTWHQSSI